MRSISRRVLGLVCIGVLAGLVACSGSTPEGETRLATPVAVPASTPRDMPTPTPIVEATILNWRVSTQIDPLTDETSVTLSILATRHNMEWPYSAPTLTVKCRSGSLKAHIHWGGQYMAAKESTFKGQVRWDAEIPRRGRWSESAQKEGTFINDSKAFVHHAREYSSVYVSVYDFSGTPHEARFEIHGLDQLYSQHSAICGPTVAGERWWYIESPAPSDFITLNAYDDSNAYFYESPSIRVSCNEDEDQVTFTFSGGGPWIEPAHLGLATMSMTIIPGDTEWFRTADGGNRSSIWFNPELTELMEQSPSLYRERLENMPSSRDLKAQIPRIVEIIQEVERRGATLKIEVSNDSNTVTAYFDVTGFSQNYQRLACS